MHKKHNRFLIPSIVKINRHGSLHTEDSTDEKSYLSTKVLLATKVAKIGLWEYVFHQNEFITDEILLSHYGLTVQGFSGKYQDLVQCVHPEDIERVSRQFKDALVHNTDIDLEFRIIWKDGSVHYIKVDAVVQHDNLGNPKCLIGTNQDITVRKQAEALLKNSESKYRSFFENSVDGILLTVTDGEVLAANPAACAIFRMTESEICAAGRLGLVDLTDPRLEILLEERRSKGKAKGEITLLRKDGSKFPGELTSAIFTDEYGEKRTCMIIRDITDRVNAEKAIRETEAFNKGMLDSLSSHIAVVNAEGTIVKVNNTWNSFAYDNGEDGLFKCGEGANYFLACKSQEGFEDDMAELALAGIQSVLNETQNEFYLEYPCHSPQMQRWFYMRVKKFKGAGSLVLIEHHDISERKKAEETLTTTSGALQQALNDLNKVMDSSLDIICSVDKEGRFVNVSAAAELILGYKPGELIGKYYIDFVFAEDLERTKTTADEIINGQSVTIFENRYVHKDGSIVPLLWSAKWDEKYKLIYCIAKDATEKKHLEKAFEIERQRFYALYVQAPSCMGIIKGPDYVYEMANPLYLQLIGKKDIIGKTVKEVLPELEAQGIFGFLDDVYNTGETFSANEMLVKFDFNGNGILVDTYLNFIYQAHRDYEGNIDGILFFAINVTEQVLSRKKIEESEKRYRQIVETAQEGIWLVDENNRTIFVNKKLCEIFEYSEEEMLGKDIYHFMDAGQKQISEKGIKRIKKGYSGHERIKYISKSGRKVWASISANPIFDENNIYKGALAMINDITAQVKLEKQLLHEQIHNQRKITKAAIDAQEKERREIGEELHDNVNQLLAASNLYLSYTLTIADDHKPFVIKSQEYLGTAMQEIRKLTKALVGPANDDSMELIGAINELIDDISLIKEIQFDFVTASFNEEEYDDGLKVVIYRIIQEQLNNILKHAEASKVVITLKKENDCLRLTIEDNGKGFDCGIIKKGIGLKNIRNRVEIYDGKVTVTSSPGNGCAMVICFL